MRNPVIQTLVLPEAFRYCTAPHTSWPAATPKSRPCIICSAAIYEQDFLGFSYGFRPGRGQHDALDALTVGITHTKVNWILDIDVRSFFDTISHEWLIRFVEHRIGDARMIRLIRKWLKAGVMDDGEWSMSETGTPQGAVVTPLTQKRTSSLSAS
jgi:retron-type reverse transcriptase